MDWKIPGTVLTGKREEAQFVPEQFRALFMGGGISLAQVAEITGLEPYTVQNWVKRGFLPPPERKRYSLRQLCRIININMLKGVLPMEKICSLLGYVNGRLDDTADDIIDDSTLYFLFVALAVHAKEMSKAEECDRMLETLLQDYQEPLPGAKERVTNALRIMLTAWLAAKMQQAAEEMLKNCNIQ